MEKSKVTPPHNRKLGLIGVSLTKARLRKGSEICLDKVRNDIEAILINTNFYDDAPFSWITLSIRYGLKDEETPHYLGISKKYGDLALGIEINVNKILEAKSEQEIERVIKLACLKSVIAAGNKYNLPVEELKKKLGKK